MKYKPLDKVRIKSLDWYNENKDELGNMDCGDALMITEKSQFCGKIVTISNVSDVIDAYKIEEDNGCYNWTDEMIEGLAEEEISQNAKLVSERFSEYVNPSEFKYAQDTITKMLLQGANIPNEYVLKDENGNVINAQKIVLEKKEKKYPKTYEECCGILGLLNVDLCFNADYRSFDASKEQWKKLGLMNQFYQLLICRDAYWKIAGEEMGLGKPWEPDWEGEGWYVIVNHRGDIVTDIQWHANAILAFPTEEMRDAFYENFKSDIEICKEFL